MLLFDDENYLYLFRNYVLKKAGLTVAVNINNTLKLTLKNLLYFIRDAKITWTNACEVWKFNYNNHWSANPIQNSHLIYNNLFEFYSKNYVPRASEVMGFISFVIDHNKSLPADKKYINYTVDETFSKKHVKEIFYGLPLVSLLEYLMNTNGIDKEKAKELGLFQMAFEFGWVEGFTKILNKLGGVNELKTLIRDNICEPNYLDVSGINFGEIMGKIIDALKKFNKKSEVKQVVFRPYLLRFINSKVTYIDEDSESELIKLINGFIDIIQNYKTKLDEKNKPIISTPDARDFWAIKYDGLNILHLAAATGSVELLKHILVTASDNIPISFMSESDNGRNILFYIKNIDQLDFILSLDKVKPYYRQMFYKVDNEGKSVLYTWINKETSIITDLLQRSFTKLPMPLEYNTDTVIPGFSETLTNYLVDNPIDNMDMLIPLLKANNLVGPEIDLYFVISKNIEQTSLTPENITELKLVLASPKVGDLIKRCIHKDYSHTLSSLINLDTSNSNIKLYLDYLITNIETISTIKPEILSIYVPSENKKAIEILLPYIYKSKFLFTHILEYLSILKKSGQTEEIRQINFLPSILEIPLGINYTANKDHISKCFAFAFYILKTYVSDSEINKLITLKSGNYKTGRSVN